MQKFLLALPAFLILLACEPDTGLETKVINDQYSMDIPAFLNPTTSLNEDASLQFQNTFQELYLIVIDESAEEFRQALVENGLDTMYTNDLQGYSELLMFGVQLELGGFGESEFKDKVINGLEARVLELETVYDGLDIYYQFAFYKGKEYYYQLMTWCLAEKRSEHQQLMTDMVNSFREL